MMGGSGSRAFWVLTGLAITFLIVFLIICVSMWGSLSALKREREDVLARKQALEQELQQQDKAALDRQNARLDERLSRLEQGLSPQEYVPTLLKQVEQEATLTRNEVVETRLGELRLGQLAGAAAETTRTADAGGAEAGAEGAAEAEAAAGGLRYDEQDITLRLRGSYKSGFDFLKALAAMRKMLYVKEMSLRKAGNVLRPDGSAEAELQLEITAYIVQPTTGFPGRMVSDVIP